MSQSSRRNLSPRIAIAIAGATGRVGAALIAGLASEPVDLIALSRKPDPSRFPAHVGQAPVDFDAPVTLAAAMQGVDRLFLAQGTSPRQVENEIALIDAAVGAGVRHIVKLSAASLPAKLHPFDWHARIEAHLISRDIGHTMLRPTTFFDTLTRAGKPVREGTWGGAAGYGIVNLIDTRDVADAAKAVLLDPASETWQRAFHLTGPRAWTMDDVAAQLTRLLGRPVAYQQRTPAEERERLLASGVSGFVVDVLTGLDRTVRESSLQEQTATVQLLTGHAPRGLPQWLEENLSLFRGTAH
ncbi:NAD(P)H-binding protein [Caballeronia zhejiangensis]|uniref:NAD(P)H-binding protein n=1 Tax=Caballeronia zhejiangensis TaxID=871203 RepID=UPI001FD49BAA|nr:NAD(P)H-binding protein [Caballeronia zhejiangensis]